MATDAPAQAIAWIAVSPDTDPIVDAHIEHPGQVVGETHRGDDWRQALAWVAAAAGGRTGGRRARDRAGLDDVGTPPGRGRPPGPGRVRRAAPLSSREPPGRVTLTVEVDDLEVRLRWLRDLGAKVLQETAGVALVEDPEGNRALLVRRRPDEPVRLSPARRPRS